MGKTRSGAGGKGKKKAARRAVVLGLAGEVGLARKAKGAAVKTLQDVLRQFGYLQPAGAVPAVATGVAATALVAVDGEFDEATEAALRLFQLKNGLPVTGVLDAGTLALMAQPRCGVPDVSVPGGAMAFALGLRWSGTNLTFSYENLTNQLPPGDVRTAIRIAFDLWSDVTPLQFTEVQGGGTISIAFRSGNHGDGFPFDTALGVLAHAFPPAPGIGGDTHFDEAETWSIDLGAIAGGAIDLVTVACHEFGHALGLEHSPTPGTLMYASYSGPHRFLASEDIARIQALYGPAP
jgi:peptidoglycan hydrolase-like protein with peptidoglycan-binding domain